ncbi:putative acetyltransferase [Methanoculleus bourgensis MS2]|nr:putative acetyltransferase [Methanoculleus bourgensis MS2]
MIAFGRKSSIVWPIDRGLPGPSRSGATSVLLLVASLSKVWKSGENSVIGTGVVVTKNIPANCLAVGIPAKVVKELDLRMQLRMLGDRNFT